MQEFEYILIRIHLSGSIIYSQMPACRENILPAGNKYIDAPDPRLDDRDLILSAFQQ